MPIETGVTDISKLNPLNPTDTDPASQGDNHIRLIKEAIKTTFPNVTGVIERTHTQINDLWHKGNDGANSGLDADLLDGKQATEFMSSNGGVMAGDLTVKSQSDTPYVLLQNNDGVAKVRIEYSESYKEMRILLRAPDGLSWANRITLGEDGQLTVNGSRVWNSSNDGTGTGLDADLLDGAHRTSFLERVAGGTVTGPVIFDGTVAVNAELDMGATIDMNGFRISELPDPNANDQPVTRGYGDGRYPQKGVTVSAGAGMSGGGDLSANRTLTLDLPSLPLSDEVPDRVILGNTTGTTQYRQNIGRFIANLPADNLLARTAEATFAAVGDTMLLYHRDAATLNQGAIVNGDRLYYAGVSTGNGARYRTVSPPGRWQLQGVSGWANGVGDASTEGSRVSLWKRIPD